MMEFRRWLKKSRVSALTGTLMLAGIAGCQTDSGTVRTYAPEAPSTAPAPLVLPEATAGVRTTTVPQQNPTPDSATPAPVPPPPAEDTPSENAVSSVSPYDEPVGSEIVKPGVTDAVAVADVSDNSVKAGPGPVTTDVPAVTVEVPEATPEVDVADAPVRVTDPIPASETPALDSLVEAVVADSGRTSGVPVESAITAVPLIDLPEPAEPVTPAETPIGNPVEVTIGDPVEATSDAGSVIPRKVAPVPALVDDLDDTGVTLPDVPLPDIELPTTSDATSDGVEDDRFVAVDKTDVTGVVSGDETEFEDGLRLLSDQRLPVFHVTVDTEGNAYLSQRDAILQVDPSGQSRIWSRVRAPRGHVILPDGSHVVCLAGTRAVVRLNASGELVEELTNRSEGSFLRSPSHVAVDGRGGIYFTDPGYARIRNPIGSLHYINSDGDVLELARNLGFPEGLALSPDGSRLVLVESQLNRVIEFQVLASGKLGPKRVLSRLPKETSDCPDGFAHSLTIDKAGRVYVAHGGTQHVEVIDRDGKVSQRHHIPNVIVNGVALDPSDPSRLFVAGSDRRTQRGRLVEVKLD